MRTDANKIAMKALRSLFGAVQPFELDVSGTRVTCSMSPGTTMAWPASITGLTRDQDGPAWIPGLAVDCAWAGGKCRLFVEVNYWTSGVYLHDLCLRVRTDRREIVFVNVSNEIEKSDDGGRATLGVRFFVTKRRTQNKAGVADKLNVGMRDLLRESKLPILGDSTAELCDIEVPSGELVPAPDVTFRRLMHLALLKLDFIDRRRIRDRGQSLVELSRWLSADELMVSATSEGDDDDDDEHEAPEDGVRQYWAGGFPEPASLEKFLAGNYWKIAWPRDSDDPAAKRTWKRFAQIRRGDYFAIKGYGGTHDLVIHLIGEVDDIDAEGGRVQLRPLDVPHYKGKGPRKRGAGNWQETIVPVTRPDVIEMVFGASAAPGPAGGGDAAKPPATAIPLNLILFGPPGTGKTYHLTHELIRHFRRAPTAADLEAQIADELTWSHAIAIALHDLGGQASVPVLSDHRLIRAMYAASATRTPLSARLWSVLQSHTIANSETVKYKSRSGEELFDKRKDSTWVLAVPLPEELQEIAQRLRAPEPAAQLDDFTFVTFHQAYGYEDFIEGIRPNVDEPSGDEEATLSYRLEDGAFMKAVRAALRLAGYRGSLHDFCGLSAREREAQFRNAPAYAIFIDEINRGNVARIFGELITLLEEDKRLGEDNEVIVQLPYSKKRFGVPPNLHVIGTMNTADRSIEALDTALRRRFEFRELSPAPETLQFTIEGDIDPEKLLRTINRRVEKLYDRDHCIGHAYLMSIEEEPTLENLKNVFRNRIIPLLQEYFFGDWGKIGLVLGKDFVRRKDTSGTPFADFDHDDHDALAERPCWELADISQLSSFAFRRIYEHVADA